MELLVTLRNKELLDVIKPHADGVIVGCLFALSYNYTLDDLKLIRLYCSENNLKFYVVIDAFISEDDKAQLYNYMEFLQDLHVDGIYFHDLAVLDIADSYQMRNLLIYDGYSVMCNSIEAAFYLSKGIKGVEISRELTLEEIRQIVKLNPNGIDMQIFGHLRMSYSKRKFIRNYLNEINAHYDYHNSDSLRLIEEKRNYKMPIIEDEYGTRIYSDFVFNMFHELPELKPLLNRGIIDTLFIPKECINDLLREYKRVTKENCDFLKQSFHKKYPLRYSSGYLYQKTNISKDE